MKLNFWQWLAVVLLAIGAAWWAYDYMHKKDSTPSAPTAPSTTQTSQGR